MNKENRTLLIIAAALAALVLIFIWATRGEAQTMTSNATSSSGSSAVVDSQASANAQGGNANNQIYIDQRAPGQITTRGTTEIKNSGTTTARFAPAVQAPSMGSGHPCGLGGSIGVSIIGGGASGGATQVDEACLLAQMGQGEAALIMIAARDSDACKALRQVGRIAAGSLCTDGERRAAAQQAREQERAAAASPRPVARPQIECVQTGTRNGRPVIQARYREGTSPETAAAFCRNQR